MSKGKQPGTSEWLILQEYIKDGRKFPTDIKQLRQPEYQNPVSEKELGAYRNLQDKKCVTSDLSLIEKLITEEKPIPGFLEAGPREELAFGSPVRPDEGLKVAVVTTGGLAPGLNSVIHTIVGRHLKTYHSLVGPEGGVWGFRNSFQGMLGKEPKWIDLDFEMTKEWSEKGGSELGAARYTDLDLNDLSKQIAENLKRWGVDILYVIGGDGSLTAANAIAEETDFTIVVGIPKTMDNDILWVWQSFGFNTAVERAASFISTLHCEAIGTRRVAILEFFGARSGFVAANAALASGHVDLVMIPEIFESMLEEDAVETIEMYKRYLRKRIEGKKEYPHAVVVIAEGVDKIFSEHTAKIGESGKFIEDFKNSLELHDMRGENIKAFSVRPRYWIRAVPANAHDQIYCKRLAALAVDNALAGFTGFMISQWLNEYVLVPLKLVAGHQKRIPPNGMFWKQVVASTGQPST